MANNMETLIYVEKENHAEAEFMSRSFVNNEIKNRAYLNALGAQLVIKYLASEGVEIENIHNMHSISKVLEKIDVSDIMLPNIHIDVRVVFDENKIFIPKSHFELNIDPDVYAVLKIDEKFAHAEFLGYCAPSQIDKKHQNSDYYFIEKDKLSSAQDFTKFVKEFEGKTSTDISENEFLKGRELSIALADHNITDSEEKELLKLLLQSDALRESVLEFDNFETLSYSAAPVLTDLLEATQTQSFDNISEDETAETLDSIETDNIEIEENESIEIAQEESLELVEDSTTEEELLDEVQEIVEDSTEEIEEETTNLELEEELVEPTLDEELSLTEDVALENLEETEETEEATVEDESSEALVDEAEQEIEEIQEEILDINEEIELPAIEEEILDETQEIVEDSTEEIEEDTTNLELEEELVEPTLDEELSLTDDVALENLEEIQEVEETTVEDESSEELVDEAEQEVEETQNETLELEENIQLDVEMNDVPSLDIEDSAELNLATDEIGEDLLGEGMLEESLDIEEPTLEGFEEQLETVSETEEEETNLETVEESLSFTPSLNLDELSVDSILDETIAAIKTEDENSDDESASTNETTEEDNEETVGSLDEAAEATAEALADAVEKAEEEAGASEDAIKLASLAGDMIDNVVGNLENSQQKNLDKIDYAKTDITKEITDVPDHILAVTEDLSLAKIEANLEAENSEQFGSPTDLTNLQEVETYEEEEFVHESVDFNSMSTISEDKLKEFATNNQENDEEVLSNFGMKDTFSAQTDINRNTEEGVVNLPQFGSSYQIGDDGTSPMDNLGSDLDFGNSTEEENLMEMDLGPAKLPQDGDLDFSSCMKPSSGRRREGSSSKSSGLNEKTKQALLANNIKFSGDSDDEESYDEDFGETITIPVDEEPFEIGSDDFATENSSDEADISELLGEFEVESETNTDTNDIVTAEDIDFITEPEVEQKEVEVTENSTTISDRSFSTGEIPIDINNNSSEDENDSLQSIYAPNSKLPGDTMLHNPGRLSPQMQNGKAPTGIIGVIGTLIVLALIGGIGFGVTKLFKNPTEEAPQPISDEPFPTSSDNGVTESNTLKIDPNNVVDMGKNTTSATKSSTTTQNVAQKKSTPTTFIEIKKLTWEVPDYISYNQQFKQYFQSVGKSLKLSLTSDLLLATDYMYSDNVRVAITFAKDGTFQNSQIIVSSGSNQIDKIVLQTVNQTLKTLKAPNSVGNDENTTAVLKIYF